MAKKYGWDDVWNGRYPNQLGAPWKALKSCAKSYKYPHPKPEHAVIEFAAKAEAIQEDVRQQYYLQTDKEGDSWLFAKDGSFAAASIWWERA